MHFWNNAHRVEQLGLDWYRDQFEGWNGEPIVGEATPGYMIWRHHPGVRRAADEGSPSRRQADRDPAQPRRPRAVGDAAPHPAPTDPARRPPVDVVREFRPVGVRLVLPGLGRLVRGEPRAVPRPVRRSAPRAVPRSGRGRSGCARTRRRSRHVGADPPTSCPSDLSRVVFSNQGGRAGRRSPLSSDDRVELWDYFRDDVARLERMLGVDLSRWAPRSRGRRRARARARDRRRSRACRSRCRRSAGTCRRRLR